VAKYLARQKAETSSPDLSSAAQRRPEAIRTAVRRLGSAMAALADRVLPLAGARQRFFHSLARLVSAGVPLADGLSTIEANSSGVIRRLAASGRSGIDKGLSLSDALAPQERVLGPVALALVGAGEQTGDLVSMLDELARIEEEKDTQLRGLLVSLAYPVTVLVLACLIMPIPQLVLGGTRSYVSGVITNLLLLAGVGLGAWFSAALSGPVVDRVLDRLPAEAERLLFPARAGLFFLIVGACVRSGMSILQALELGGKVFGSTRNRDLVQEAARRVREGRSLADGLGRLCRVEDRVLVAAGEQAGTMDKTFGDMSRAHLQRATRRRKAVMAVVSVLLALAMVGWVASSVVRSYQRQIEAPMEELEREMGREMRGIWNNR